MIVVSDSSPLIALSIVERLDLVELIYDRIEVPSAVYQEVTHLDKPFASELEKFLSGRVVEVTDSFAVSMLLGDIGQGEAEAIVLAFEEKAKGLLVDDRKARRVARMKGLPIVGTLGLLLHGRRLGAVAEIRPLIQRLSDNGIRISDRVIEITLNEAGEA